MIKKGIMISVFLFSLLFMIGCSQMTGNLTVSENQESINAVEYSSEDIPARKIIYTVDISFDVRNLEESSQVLESLIEADEWFDEEILNSSTHYYVIRIKTDRLDDFIAALEDVFTLRSFEKVATDISLEYQDATNRILSLEAQLSRLLDLYDQANMSEMIMINEQVSDIEVELQQLHGTLNQFDSLVDYSEVTLRFYGSTIVSQSPFINRLGNAFVNGFNALLIFFDRLAIVFATILPFLGLFGVITVSVVLGYKKRKKAAKKGKQNSTNQ